MNDNTHTQPVSRPPPVEYFFVAVNKQSDSYKLLLSPVSPYFRTLEEAKAFHTTFKIEGSYCAGSTHYPRSAEDAKQHEEELFGSETKQLATQA